MQSESTLKRHAHLVDRMATATGVDLEEEMLRGNLSIPDLDDAVLRCTGCTCPNACTTWLAQHSGPFAEGQPATPPAYCRNADLFADLKPS